jgi:hypothetical protein
MLPRAKAAIKRDHTHFLGRALEPGIHQAPATGLTRGQAVCLEAWASSGDLGPP